MSAHYLAFETGGTKLVAAVAGPDARILETRAFKRAHEDRADTSFARMLELGRELRSEYEARGARFVSAGVGFGGTVDRNTRRPHRCLHEEGWGEIDIVGRIEKDFGLPAAIENDCKVAALGEARFGAGAGARTVFYITLGTGVGGGLVTKGSIVELGPIGEAEIGHMVIDPEGPQCWCGGRGCVESMCSGPGVSRLAAWLAERQPELFAASRFSGDAEAIPSKEYFVARRDGDRFADLVVSHSARALATAVAAAVNLTAADMVVVGGGVGSGNPDFVAEVGDLARPRIVNYFREGFRIAPAGLGAEVVTQGAAVLALQV